MSRNAVIIWTEKNFQRMSLSLDKNMFHAIRINPRRISLQCFRLTKVENIIIFELGYFRARRWQALTNDCVIPMIVLSCYCVIANDCVMIVLSLSRCVRWGSMQKIRLYCRHPSTGRPHRPRHLHLWGSAMAKVIIFCFWNKVELTEILSTVPSQFWSKSHRKIFSFF